MSVLLSTNAFLKAASRYTKPLDDMVKSLATLSDTLSMFEHSNILYPENPKLSLVTPRHVFGIHRLLSQNDSLPSSASCG